VFSPYSYPKKKRFKSANLCLRKNHSFPYDPIWIDVRGLLGLQTASRAARLVISHIGSKTGDYVYENTYRGSDPLLPFAHEIFNS
jgi:hypothetical protein